MCVCAKVFLWLCRILVDFLFYFFICFVSFVFCGVHVFVSACVCLLLFNEVLFH